MTIEDFNKEGKNYISKAKYFFENNKVQFWYRYLVRTHIDQPNWDGIDYTTYSILLSIDEESIHERWKKDILKEITCSYLLREKTYKGDIDKTDFNKAIKGIEKLKIESKIKANNYQKIIGIINGCDFYI